MDKLQIKEIVLDQYKIKLEENMIEREIFPKLESYINNKFIIIISGLRRSGKSTLLQQLRKKYDGYYLNFDDERLVNFKLEDFQHLYEIFIELFGEKNIFYFDEIQNIIEWERFIRRLHDNRKKIIISGSNASMLSKELGTHLTGRYLEIRLFPFSYKEFLRLFNREINVKFISLTENKANLKRDFNEYLLKGGLPEYLKTDNVEYLKILYENILYKDIIVRYKLPNERVLKELVNYIAANIAKEISYNSIKNLLQIGSATSVKDYFNYFENTYLIFLLPCFNYSLKKQIYLSKKVYLIDNALIINLGFRLSRDGGRLLENLVFIELKRKNKELYFFKEKNECDFVIKEQNKITQAIQVCYDLNEENKKRELNGLLEALERFKLKKGIILTYDNEEEMKIGNKKINIKPIWKWLLED